MSKLPATIGQKLAAPFRATARGLKRIGNWYKHQFVGRPWWYKLCSALWSFALFIAPVCLCGYFQSLLAVWQIAHNGRNPPSQDGCRL